MDSKGLLANDVSECSFTSRMRYFSGQKPASWAEERHEAALKGSMESDFRSTALPVAAGS